MVSPDRPGTANASNEAANDTSVVGEDDPPSDGEGEAHNEPSVKKDLGHDGHKVHEDEEEEEFLLHPSEGGAQPPLASAASRVSRFASRARATKREARKERLAAVYSQDVQFPGTFTSLIGLLEQNPAIKQEFDELIHRMGYSYPMKGMAGGAGIEPAVESLLSAIDGAGSQQGLDLRVEVFQEFSQGIPSSFASFFRAVLPSAASGLRSMFSSMKIEDRVTFRDAFILLVEFFEEGIVWKTSGIGISHLEPLLVEGAGTD